MYDLFRNGHTASIDETIPVTPIEKRGNFWMKRDDFYQAAGANGSKARAAHYLIKTAIDEGAKFITTAGSRKSPQINIVAQICQHYKIPFEAHCPQGELGGELQMAKEAGAQIVQHRAGYNSVIIARARDAATDGGYNVPFGMACHEAIDQVARQRLKIPAGVKRIVVTVGSAVNLCGILHLLRNNKQSIPVLGIVVGAKPIKTLDKLAPDNWREMVTLQNAGVDYHHEIKENTLEGVRLDPIYEAKCKPFIKAGDLFWVIGIRGTLADKQIPKFNF